MTLADTWESEWGPELDEVVRSYIEVLLRDTRRRVSFCAITDSLAADIRGLAQTYLLQDLGERETFRGLWRRTEAAMVKLAAPGNLKGRREWHFQTVVNAFPGLLQPAA